MGIRVKAMYEEGVLKPLEKVSLKEDWNLKALLTSLRTCQEFEYKEDIYDRRRAKKESKRF